MMDRRTIKRKLDELNGKQITELIEYLYQLNTSKERIDFSSLPREYSGLIKHYSKLASDEKCQFLAITKDYALERINGDEKTTNQLNKVQAIAEENFLATVPKNINKNDIKKRTKRLSFNDKDKLINYFELIISKQKFNVNNISPKMQGLIKLFNKSSGKERLTLLEFIREQLAEETMEDTDLYVLVAGINLVINEVKKDNILEILEKAGRLSAEYQESFMDEIYHDVVSVYSRLAKESRINNCCHEFGEWKDHSYTVMKEGRIDLQVGVYPVEQICWSRKCKKCGFVESVDYIPEEVIKKQKEAKRKKKIKQLRRELKELETQN